MLIDGSKRCLISETLPTPDRRRRRNFRDGIADIKIRCLQEVENVADSLLRLSAQGLKTDAKIAPGHLLFPVCGCLEVDPRPQRGSSYGLGCSIETCVSAQLQLIRRLPYAPCAYLLY